METEFRLEVTDVFLGGTRGAHQAFDFVGKGFCPSPLSMSPDT
jgi:hypothetical protein